MAVVNCHISLTLSQDSSTNPSSAASPTPRQTKILLPKKKPQKWSTGMAPGEWGGPPTTTKLRKYWGGQVEDPLTCDDFIWNKDFMDRMKKLIEYPADDENSSSDPFISPSKEESSGFLSLNRVMSLDNLEVDLSKELMTPSKTIVEEDAVETQAAATASRRWRPAPTRREKEKWDRATKAATGGSDLMLREIRQPKGDPEVLAAQYREQYFKLKKKLQFLTLGIGGIGVISAYISYTPGIAASYGAGLLGSLAYMRMLGNTVDSMADGAKGLIKGAAGQPRLLVPVVLVMIFNKWNGILVPEYGFIHLELIPMLVGFFTYKIATFFQTIEEAITVTGEKTQV
ncbi:hypothetical protein ACH5RR_037127 [Cinchona calisaya]|uniref:CGL160/ATPI domain-containing protein n=1 Tax=Cinchona calisaya TaxID=153742 RepID=A0ABD2Y5B1_9GENT